MAWLDAVDGNEFIRKLFPADTPLNQIELHDVVLQRDGPTCVLRFDLADFPDSPPRHWQAQRFNTVQVALYCVGVKHFAAVGWALCPRGKLSIGHTHQGLGVVAAGERLHLRFVADSVLIESVSAYQKTAVMPVALDP